jgi:hypothetical protein
MRQRQHLRGEPDVAAAFVAVRPLTPVRVNQRLVGLPADVVSTAISGAGRPGAGPR